MSLLIGPHNKKCTCNAVSVGHDQEPIGHVFHATEPKCSEKRWMYHYI